MSAPKPMFDKEALVSTKDAAEYCDMKEGAFRNRLSRGSGPKRTKRFKYNLFKISDLDEWIAKNVTVVDENQTWGEVVAAPDKEKEKPKGRR